MNLSLGGPSDCLVSVVIPTYNRSRYLGEAIQSVLEQTYRTIQVIVVDDGSTDNTAQVVKKWQRYVEYYHQENQGVSSARNLGIKHARGEYIMFLDSDDIILPDKIERQVTFLETHLDFDVVYCWWQFIDPFGALLGEGGAAYRGNVLEQLLEWNFAPFHSFLFRSQCIKNAGGFEKGIEGVEDWDMLIRIALSGALFDVIQIPLVQYRMHGKNAICDTTRMLRHECKMLEKHFANPNLPEEIREKRAFTYFVVRLEACTMYYRQGRYKEAEALFCEAIAKYPRGLVTDVFFDKILNCLHPPETGCYTPRDEIRGKTKEIKQVYNFFAHAVSDCSELTETIAESRRRFLEYMDRHLDWSWDSSKGHNSGTTFQRRVDQSNKERKV